ncbi:hypothetical protein E0H39_30945 [Rhizobium leguminosarum bv. viciae]|nr:hypothetical protein [Rhizobium leguminosarum bv. viciae]PUB61449.1 hypothetical protein DB728_26870 [Rhizobium leguminosarum bv. viciae USDA 2370]RWX42689.1 hypothetical protein EHH54_00050 [Rhizobium leguminosarum]NKJ99354.1 hypothetical protein [Rhizobium leguminosarum bv. viciae]NKK17516.1 hypothetical protein [Rhizobium leguminosarum bv. viciae]
MQRAASFQPCCSRKAIQLSWKRSTALAFCFHAIPGKPLRTFPGIAPGSARPTGRANRALSHSIHV